jgi:hypothetical protein
MATYEINININGDIQGESQITGNARTLGEDKSSNKVSNSSKALGNYIASQTIKPFINQATNYIVSNVELTTGSTQLQQKVDFAMEAVNTGISAWSNAAAGAALTTSMGLGGPIGIGIGLALTAVTKGMDIIFKQQQINLKREEENRQINYLTNRAGPAFNSSRRGE